MTLSMILASSTDFFTDVILITRFILFLLSVEILCILFAAADSENEYCDLQCSSKLLKHTMCLYSPGPNKQTCKDYRNTSLSHADEDSIVDIHNHIRNRLANGEESLVDGTTLPPSSNMMEMKWDDELAEIAQRWADQCRFEHDKCRNSERFSVGQNIAISSTKDESYATRFIYQFYKELNLFSPSTISGQSDSSDRFRKVGHYTQMIWATTEYIGCARVSYRRDKKYGLYQSVVCNYGPAGNVHGQDIYQVGTPCSMCPSGTGCSKTYPALCTHEITI